ncbi:hypothetical protein [Candidatus Hodgkinia cicadicola]|uniref:hypothetical protein n=1 Tax=Candidatus Hodgkinia cicadicola TaxID=573658 RepID=UPI0011BA7C90
MFYVLKPIRDRLVKSCSKTTYDTTRYHVWVYVCKRSHNDIEGKRTGIRPTPGCSNVQTIGLNIIYLE